MIQCSRLAYISVVDEHEERCERNDLGQAVAGQSYFDADLQQTTYTVQGPHTVDRPHMVQRPHTQRVSTATATHVLLQYNAMSQNCASSDFRLHLITALASQGLAAGTLLANRAEANPAHYSADRAADAGIIAPL